MEEKNDAFDQIIKTLKRDGGVYISVLILLGYLFTAVQMIVRYAYYGVELTYLLNIKLEDILLALDYVMIISFMPIFAYELSQTNEQKCRRRIILKQVLFTIICWLFAFALTQRIAFDFFALFFSLQVIADIIAARISNQIFSLLKKHLDYLLSIKGLATLLLFFIAIICSLQFFIEAYNHRFTYLFAMDGDNEREYIVLTTFKDNYITIESEIEDDYITIYRGHVRLVPISDSSLYERQFSEKQLK